MAKRKANDGTEIDAAAAKLYGAPPPLSDELIRRLQGAVEAARRERTPSPRRSINPFLDTPSATPELPENRDSQSSTPLDPAPDRRS